MVLQNPIAGDQMSSCGAVTEDEARSQEQWYLHHEQKDNVTDVRQEEKRHFFRRRQLRCVCRCLCH